MHRRSSTVLDNYNFPQALQSLHQVGYQPFASGFGQYWGLKPCESINTQSKPMSAPSQLLLSLLDDWHFFFSILPSLSQILSLCDPVLPPVHSQFVFHSSMPLHPSNSRTWQGLLIGNKLWEGFQIEVKITSQLPPAVYVLLSFGCGTGLFTGAECRCQKHILLTPGVHMLLKWSSNK